jgi:hypothetical protein
MLALGVVDAGGVGATGDPDPVQPLAVLRLELAQEGIGRGQILLDGRALFWRQAFVPE